MGFSDLLLIFNLFVFKLHDHLITWTQLIVFTLHDHYRVFEIY